MKESIFGEIGHKRGMSAEDKVERVLSQMLSEKNTGIPNWLLGHKNPTKKEDAKKIDRWIVTDVGKIKLQIKSSQEAAKKSREKYPNIPVIVVRQGDNDHLIMSRIISAIGQQRKVYLQKRNRLQE